MTATRDFGLDRAGVLERIARLPGFPKDFVVVGGSAMALNGLRTARTLDLLVGPELWGQCAYGPEWRMSYWDAPNNKIRMASNSKLGMEIYQDLTIPGCPLSYGVARRSAVIVGEVPCLPLPLLRTWKRARGRGSDMGDIHLIDRWAERY
jgi:hypothetical protein